MKNVKMNNINGWTKCWNTTIETFTEAVTVRPVLGQWLLRSRVNTCGPYMRHHYALFLKTFFPRITRPFLFLRLNKYISTQYSFLLYMRILCQNICGNWFWIAWHPFMIKAEYFYLKSMDGFRGKRQKLCNVIFYETAQYKYIYVITFRLIWH